MADPITKQQLIDASQDAETLEQVVNGGNTLNVTSREGRVYPTIAKALYQVIQTGGFEPFLTQSALLASVPTVPKKAAKALDTKKIWYWDGSSWTDTGLSELDQATAALNLFKSEWGITLLNTDDLNNCIANKTYFCRLNTVTSPDRNYPTNQAGLLVVNTSDRFVYQQYYEYQSKKSYFRSGFKVGGGGDVFTWYDWREIVDQNHLNENTAEILAVMENNLNNILDRFNLSTDKIIDTEGNIYKLSVLSTALQKIIFGITKDSGLVLGNLRVYQNGKEFLISDYSGRSIFRYKDENIYFMNYKISFKNSGITLLDEKGKALFRISDKGTLYATKYLNLPENLVATTPNYQIADSGQFKETDVTHELVYGQSLSVSTTSAVPLQSVTQPYDNIMFSGGVRLRVGDVGFISNSFSPLVEAVKETPCSGICNGLSQRFINAYSNRGATVPTLLGTTTGEGGKDILYLSPIEDGGNVSPSRFDDTIKIVQYAKNICVSQNKTYAVGSYYWVQGENDGDTPMYLYDIRLRNLKQRFDEKILNITSQRYRPNMIIAQTAGHRRYNRSYFGACLSQLRMSNLHDDMILAVPIYQLPHSNDFLHLNGFGAWLLGQYLAKASFYTRYMGQKWKPLQPSWVKWSDTEIIVGGWNPHGTTLIIDNALCATTENAGFDLFSPNNTLLDIISNVQLVDNTTIKITLSSPAPMDARLCCGRGRDYMNGTTMGGPQTGARTNIRDDHGEFDQVINPLDSSVYKMHNASVMWQYDRQNGFNSI